MKRKVDKKCPTCKKDVHGRSDKVFCTLTCKDKHRELEKDQTPEIQGAGSKGIIRNYVVAVGILGYKNEAVIIHRDLLFKHGFDVNKFLNTKFCQNSKVYCIQNIEFILLENDLVKIYRVKRKNKQTFIKEFLDRWECEFPDGVRMKWGVLKNGLRIYFKRITLDSTVWLSDTALYSVLSRTDKPPT